jgi:uncharacterized protein
MAEVGSSSSLSPFHPGEIAAQERFGVRERMAEQGKRVIRDYLPEQHRQFFHQLPFLLAGTVDAQGQPWTSILTGNPGFLSTPDARTLRVAASPLPEDPIRINLEEGAPIGLLGIELHTRRRNRMNGTIVAPNLDGFDVQVGQSFGNCPKYIQARDYEPIERSAPVKMQRLSQLDTAAHRLISTADTFFIASAYLDESAGLANGVDVSHRGGKPGFVRIDNKNTLTVPDFSGNLHFNTVGNLMLNPKAGLLFVDFERGDLLYISSEAEVIWEGEEVKAFDGAERLLRFHIKEGIYVEGSLPLHWSSPEISPFLASTGSWATA